MQEKVPSKYLSAMYFHFLHNLYLLLSRTWEHAMAQLVEALRYKLAGCGFDSLWCHWNFSLT
jgi:hypothetical protein